MDSKRARFEAQILPHLDAAYRFAFALARRRADAEDVLQEAALRAFRSLDTLRGREAKPWLLTIVRHCFLSSRTRERAHLTRPPPGALPDEDSQGHADCAPTPEEAALVEADRRALGESLAQLAEEHREILLLREVEELSYREIATVLGIPIGTVMSRLARARAALKVIWLTRQASEAHP